LQPRNIFEQNLHPHKLYSKISQSPPTNKLCPDPNLKKFFFALSNARCSCENQTIRSTLSLSISSDHSLSFHPLPDSKFPNHLTPHLNELLKLAPKYLRDLFELTSCLTSLNLTGNIKKKKKITKKLNKNYFLLENKFKKKKIITNLKIFQLYGTINQS
jgi:hypothetical protein